MFEFLGNLVQGAINTVTSLGSAAANLIGGAINNVSKAVSSLLGAKPKPKPKKITTEAKERVLEAQRKAQRIDVIKKAEPSPAPRTIPRPMPRPLQVSKPMPRQNIPPKVAAIKSEDTKSRDYLPVLIAVIGIGITLAIILGRRR